MRIKLLTLGLVCTMGVATLAAAAAPPKKGAPKRTVPAKAAPVKAAVAPPPKPVAPPPMWAVAFSPDGARLAVGTYRRVLVYDAATGAKVADYPVSRDAVRAVAFSPDGKLLAAGTGIPGDSGAAVVVEAATGKAVRTVQGHADTVEALAWADDATLLAAADDEKVSVTDVGTGKAVGTLAEHVGRCLSVAVPTKISDAAGGAIFATGGADKMVKIWDAKARRVVVNFDQAQCPVWCLAPLTARPGAFVGGGDDGKLRWFTVRTVGKGTDGIAERSGSVERTIEAHDGPVYSVAPAPNDRFFVSGGADRRVVQWNPGGGKRREWTDAARDVWGVAVSPDAKRIAAASLDGRTRVYDAENGALVFTLDANGVLAAPPPVPEGKK
jgi:WD40 repeat protein